MKMIGILSVIGLLTGDCRLNKIVSVRKLKAIDLLPFPHRIPYANFSNYCLAFTLFQKNKDLPVLENLAKLMGMQVEFSEENTTHLVYCDYDSSMGLGQGEIDEDLQLKQSIKVQTIKRTFKKKQPKLVKFDWFLNCILNGIRVDETEYEKDINSI